MNRKQKTYIGIGVFILLFFSFFSFFSFENQGVRADVTYASFAPNLDNQQLRVAPLGEIVQTITPDGFLNFNELTQGEDSAVYLADEQSATMTVTVPLAGYYHLSFNYLTLGNEMVDPIVSIKINGEYQTPHATRIPAPINWRAASHDFGLNRFGHEMVAPSEQINEWAHTYAFSAINWTPTPILFYLEAGENEITLTNRLSEMYLGSVFVTAPRDIPSYDQYKAFRGDGTVGAAVLHIIEGQLPIRQNSSFIRQISMPTPDVYPYNSRAMVLNAIGGESWMHNGQSITWVMDVPVAGFYQLTVHGHNETLGTAVFRTIKVNGEIPFTELEAYPFAYSRRFANHTLSDETGTPFEIYLNEGLNEITMTVNSQPIMDVVNTLGAVREEIGVLALDIRQLTGGQNDPNRDWDLEEFIPNINDLFTSWIERVANSRDYLANLFPDSTESNAQLELQLVINGLTRLAARPNELPARMSELSEGATSASQMLGTIEQHLQEQAFTISSIYIHTEQTTIPRATTSLPRRIHSQVAQFWASFNVTDATPAGDDVLEIWVSRSQFHVELLQNMADSMFTPETGIHVRFSVMPNPQKLVLANAAGEQPDLALGVVNWLPFQMALRGAAADLTQFDGFEEMLENFSSGAFLPLMIDDGLYGFPETQDFYVMFYRADMLNQLDIPVPDTWDDVVQILPELQRQGLNFFTPLSGPSAMKPFMFTAPYFYQFGGDVHSPDALSTAINSEESLQALRFMTDLYMVYSLPLQVANFYNDFRYGTIPIGISNFQTYLELTVAAPEIAGLWNIAPHPGVMDAEGNVTRYATGSAGAAMILEASENQEAAWTFLQWWLSTQTQVAFSHNLATLFGPGFIWHTANLEAFAQAPIPPEHRDVIIQQWEWMREVPLTPASYIIEREVSNIWNRVVFDGENLRTATDAAVIRINREIRRRMEEFDYVDSLGNPIRPYILPTIERVEEWKNND